MWWSAILLGLLSSTHCLGMCGPLQGAFTSMFLRKGKWALLFIYHFSRILTYGLLGLLAGILGIAAGLQNWQQQTSLIGGLLLLFGFLTFYLLKLDQKLFSLFFPYIQKVRARLQKSKKYEWAYFGGSGALNGILPCAMVYLAILPAMGSGGLGEGFIYMILFGLGTMPLLLLANLGALSFFTQHPNFSRKATPVLIVITAGLLILRGMDLGIPYLSPQLPDAFAGEIEGCK
jgi:sulfite exporter TauE/SafE